MESEHVHIRHMNLVVEGESPARARRLARDVARVLSRDLPVPARGRSVPELTITLEDGEAVSSHDLAARIIQQLSEGPS